MSKKDKIKKETVNSANKNNYSIYSFRMQAIIIALIGLIFYVNSFNNEYALDDGIVIEKNEYVQKGFKGIKKILKSDAYASFYEQMNAKQQLSGGRYRPLSIVTFAIEQQIFGSKEKNKPTTDLATLRHVVNVLLYILSAICLLYFLRNYLLPESPTVAFAATLLFLIHPMHTEVVSNVKSRDEIMSFLFIVLTFISAFNYRNTKKMLHLIVAIVFYFLALLSKEYAITLIVLLPMLFFILHKDTFVNSIIKTLPYIVTAGIYIYIRFQIVGKGATNPNPDVLNNPFMFATKPETIATKIEILNHYLRLLFFPHPLSSDYSYNTIPYTNFSDIKVWLSILIHLSMIGATIVLFFRKHILSFALAFYLLHLALVSNLIMDIGATMGERLVYHSSFGFVLIVAWAINKGLEKIQDSKMKMNIGIGLAVVIVLFSAFKTIPRNAEWKNDATLFIADVETVPNSALANGNAGKAYIDMSEKEENKNDEALQKEFIDKAIKHLSKAVNVHNKYVNGYINLGVAYYKKGELEKAEENWIKAKSLYPNNPYLVKSYEALAQGYYNKAMKIWKTDSLQSIVLMEKATAYQPLNVDYWYNLGGAAFTVGNYEKAKKAWEKTLQLNPNHKEALQGLAALSVKK